MQEMQTLFNNFGNDIQKFLPTSPFKGLIGKLDSIDFGYLNWFFPVGEIINLLLLWVTAIGIFYVYMVILRWLKFIE